MMPRAGHVLEQQGYKAERGKAASLRPSGDLDSEQQTWAGFGESSSGADALCSVWPPDHPHASEHPDLPRFSRSAGCGPHPLGPLAM